MIDHWSQSIQIQIRNIISSKLWKEIFSRAAVTHDLFAIVSSTPSIYLVYKIDIDSLYRQSFSYIQVIVVNFHLTLPKKKEYAFAYTHDLSRRNLHAIRQSVLSPTLNFDWRRIMIHLTWHILRSSSSTRVSRGLSSHHDTNRQVESPETVSTPCNNITSDVCCISNVYIENSLSVSKNTERIIVTVGGAV